MRRFLPMLLAAVLALTPTLARAGDAAAALASEGVAANVVDVTSVDRLFAGWRASLVRVIETGRCAGNNGQRELEWNARALTAGLREHGAQVLPVHVLHREVVNAEVFADLEHLRDSLGRRFMSTPSGLREAPRFDYETLRRLPRGEAIAEVASGGQLLPPVRIRLPRP